MYTFLLLLRRPMRSLRRNTRGGVALMTAALMPIVLTISAIAIDLGVLYIARNKADAIVTLAAEAGVKRLPDTAAAERTARRVARGYRPGGPAEGLGIAVAAASDRITVSIDTEIETIFGHLVSRTSLKVSTSATRIR